MAEQGNAWDGINWTVEQLVEDHSANARHELARRLLVAEAEVERLRRRCEMRDRAAARWSEAAAREVPTPAAIEKAREDFVECKIRQEDAPAGSIMRRVCDAAMALVDLLDERDTAMKARVVELALERDRQQEIVTCFTERPAAAYQPLDHAMQILRPCLHAYSGEQAQAVAKALREWHDKWAALVDALHVLRRDAFDAGARAMRDAARVSLIDITALPGRPQ